MKGIHFMNYRLHYSVYYNNFRVHCKKIKIVDTINASNSCLKKICSNCSFLFFEIDNCKIHHLFRFQLYTLVFYYDIHHEFKDIYFLHMIGLIVQNENIEYNECVYKKT